MPDEQVPQKLTYSDIEVLEATGKHYTGNHQEQWVDTKSLCTTCSFSHITRRHSQNKRTVYCTSICKFIPEDISECNAYHNFTELTLQQMGNMAIVIDPRPDRYKGYL